MSQFYPYAKQSISEEDIQAVASSLKQEIITRGSKVEEFEETIATYCGAPYAVAFNSGSSALAAAYDAAQINSFDRIITSPNTFIATISEAWKRNAEPLFIDIDLNTGNIDLNLLALNVDYVSTRGRNIIVPIHFAGIPVNMKKLSMMIKDPDTVVIEDAAHAFGSSYEDGSKVGSCMWSDMTIFSFHPAKTITTGEGGMVLTKDEHYYHRLIQYRNNGIKRENPPTTYPGYYRVMEVSGNYNMTEMQAALGLSQFNRLNQFFKKRQELINQYHKELDKEKHISFLNTKQDTKVCFHLCATKIDFTALKKERKNVMEALFSKGIGTQVHYIPLYSHPFFLKNKPNISPYFPKMEEYFSKALSLPLYYDLTIQDIKKISSDLRKVLKSTS